MLGSAQKHCHCVRHVCYGPNWHQTSCLYDQSDQQYRGREMYISPPRLRDSLSGSFKDHYLSVSSQVLYGSLRNCVTCHFWSIFCKSINKFLKWHNFFIFWNEKLIFGYVCVLCLKTLNPGSFLKIPLLGVPTWVTLAFVNAKFSKMINIIHVCIKFKFYHLWEPKWPR